MDIVINDKDVTFRNLSTESNTGALETNGNNGSNKTYKKDENAKKNEIEKDEEGLRMKDGR